MKNECKVHYKQTNNISCRNSPMGQATFRSSHRDNFRKYLLFSSRRLSVFTEQILIFQEGICFRRTDCNFPGDVFSVRQPDNNFPGRYIFFAEQISFFPARFVCSSNRYQFSRSSLFLTTANRYRFSRSTFLVTEQILIFQEAYFKYHQIGNFREGTLQTDILAIGLGCCFRTFH